MSKYIVLKNFKTASIVETKQAAMAEVSGHVGKLGDYSKEKAGMFLEYSTALEGPLSFYSDQFFSNDAIIFEVN